MKQMVSLIPSLLVIFMSILLVLSPYVEGRLSPTFYSKSCPNVSDIITSVIKEALVSDPRITASLMRLHFHDCFVQGCDGSVLLDDYNGTTITVHSEKRSPPNRNSTRGFDVVDNIKAAVEESCPGVVSCADILALTAESSVHLAGGPRWRVLLGRRDSRNAYQAKANTSMPAPTENLANLRAKFAAVGLDVADLVALSGAHTFGRSACRLFRSRLYNFNNTASPDPTLNDRYAASLRHICPEDGDPYAVANFDPRTPDKFDTEYFSNLKKNLGLLTSDQVLFSTPDAPTIPLVDLFSRSKKAFFESFAKSMIRMGNISPLTGDEGEIRANCRMVNGAS